MSRYEKLKDDQHYTEVKSCDRTETVHDEDTMLSVIHGHGDNQLSSSNYLSVVHEEQSVSEEHKNDSDENDDDENQTEEYNSDDVC